MIFSSVFIQPFLEGFALAAFFKDVSLEESEIFVLSGLKYILGGSKGTFHFYTFVTKAHLHAYTHRSPLCVLSGVLVECVFSLSPT